MPRKVIGRELTNSTSSPDIGGMESFLTPKQSSPGSQSTFGFFNQNAGSDMVTPKEVQRIKREAKNGDLSSLYQLYETMETTDTRYGGLIDSYYNAVTRMPVKVEPAETDSAQEERLARDYANLVEENLDHIDRQRLLKSFLRAAIYGARVYGVKYVVKDFPYGKKIALIDGIREVPNEVLRMDTRYKSQTNGELAIQMRQEDEHPTPLADLDDRMVFSLEDGQGRGKYHIMGKARKCVTWWLLRRYAQIWWSEFVEVYGQPLRVGYYPRGAKNELISRMQGFMQTLGKDHYGLFPQGSDIHLKESKNSGNNTIFSDLMRMGADEMAIAIVGQVETMGDRRYGSRAKAQELAKIRFEELEHAARVSQRGFQQFAARVIGVNYGPGFDHTLLPRVGPVVVDPSQAKMKMDLFQQQADSGIAVPLDHVYEHTAVPRPKDGENVLVGRSIEEYNAESPQGNEQESTSPAPNPNPSDQ